MENVRTLSFADKQLFENLARQNPSPSCERCFSTAYIWRSTPEYVLADWHGRAVFHRRDIPLICYPLGDDTPPEELNELLREFADMDLKSDFIYDAPPNYFEMFPNACEFFKPNSEVQFYDYLYDVDKLAELRGALLRKKRNHIKHFETENPDWKLEEISEKNLPEARAFVAELADESEIIPAQKAFEKFRELALAGLLLRASGGKVAAVAMLGRINDETWTVHFEKSDKSWAGAAQAIVKHEAEFLRDVGAKIMNREQDLGLENLRRAKRSLDPIMFKRLNLVPVKSEL